MARLGRKQSVVLDTLISDRNCHIPIFGAMELVLPNIASVAATISLSLLLLLCGLLPSNFREVLMMGGAAPLLAFVVLAFSHPKSLSSRLFGFCILFEAGAVSYITYILQSPVWHIFQLAMGRARSIASGHPTGDWQFGLYLGLLILVSFLVRQAVERPARRLLLADNRLSESGRGQNRLPDPSREAA